MLIQRIALAVGLFVTVYGCNNSGASSDAGAPTDTIAADVSHDTGSFTDVRRDTALPDTGTADAGTTPDTGTGAAPDVAMLTDTGPVDAGPCGGCARGFTCATDGICRASSGIPAFGDVYLIVMENESQTSIRGSASAPYINELLRTATVASNYQSVAHPSLPNYIALTSGGTQGIICDCQPAGQSGSCNPTCILLPACNCNQNVPHLGDQLDEATLSWREYGQSMGTPCNIVNSSPYAAKHIPFLYYDNVRTNPTRCTSHVRDYGDFMADRGTYRFSMISPDLCHDMHDRCTPTNDAVRQGDDWLNANVSLITSAPGFSTNGVLFIVWDEGDLSLSNAIMLITISPLSRGAYTSTVAYNHYSLLATIQDGLGLPRLGSSVGAMPLTDLFH